MAGRSRAGGRGGRPAQGAAALEVRYHVRLSQHCGDEGLGLRRRRLGHVVRRRAVGPTARTLTADVVAATADGGLAVDVFEEAPDKSATVRFGVVSNKLLFDQNAIIFEEEPEFVHYLARDLIKPTELQVGTTWTDKFSAQQLSGEMTYRVTAIDTTNNTIVVDITGDSNSSGITSMQTTTSGSFTYDTATSVPEKLSVSTRSLIRSGQTLTTKSTQLTATLVEDSFRKS